MHDIIFHPAECCWRACKEPECPYMHHDSWEVNGKHYGTEREAREALSFASAKRET